MSRLLLIALLAFPIAARAATVTHEVATGDTGATPNTSGAFTPALDDLLVVGVCATGTVDATPTLSSSVGGFTFTMVDSFVISSGQGHTGYIFVSDALVSSATSQTVTWTEASDPGTGTTIMVEAVAGVTKNGLDAILQNAADEDNGPGQTPTVVFAGAVDTDNPTIGFVCAAANPPAVTEPSGWTELAEAGHATPDHGGEVVARDSGFADTTITWGSTFGTNGAAAAVEIDTSAASEAANFTAGPTEAPATDGYTISGTLSGNGFGALVAYAVAVNPGDGTPTCTQIKAGQNDGGSAALLAASETWTEDVGDSFALTAANTTARKDIHVCASDGTNDTSVTSLTDQDRSPRSGYAIHALTSVSATSIFDDDAYFDPDVATDVIEYEDDTNESADCNVSFEADGDFILTPVMAGDCDGRQTFEISYQDVSSATTGLFTAPTVGNFTTDDTVYVNNSVPVCDPEPSNAIVLLDEDEAMVAIDVSTLGGCTDDDGDQLDATVTVGTLPNGSTLSGTGNLTWSGTPDTEDEAGEAITIEICDIADDCDTFQFTVYTVNTWTVPDLSGLDASAAADAIVTAAPWRENDVGLSISGLTCDPGTAGLVLTQDPAASAEAEPFEEISTTLSQLCASGRGIRLRLATDQ